MQTDELDRGRPEDDKSVEEILKSGAGHALDCAWDPETGRRSRGEERVRGDRLRTSKLGAGLTKGTGK